MKLDGFYLMEPYKDQELNLSHHLHHHFRFMEEFNTKMDRPTGLRERVMVEDNKKVGNKANNNNNNKELKTKLYRKFNKKLKG